MVVNNNKVRTADNNKSTVATTIQTVQLISVQYSILLCSLEEQYSVHHVHCLSAIKMHMPLGSNKCRKIHALLL